MSKWELLFAAVGLLLILGAVRNWNWLCDPTGAPYSHLFGRGARRVIFLLLGLVLVIVSLWSLALGYSINLRRWGRCLIM